jgi:hypothetical protein
MPNFAKYQEKKRGISNAGIVLFLGFFFVFASTQPARADAIDIAYFVKLIAQGLQMLTQSAANGQATTAAGAANAQMIQQSTQLRADQTTTGYVQSPAVAMSYRFASDPDRSLKSCYTQRGGMVAKDLSSLNTDLEDSLDIPEAAAGIGGNLVEAHAAADKERCRLGMIDLNSADTYVQKHYANNKVPGCITAPYPTFAGQDLNPKFPFKYAQFTVPSGVKLCPQGQSCPPGTLLLPDASSVKGPRSDDNTSGGEIGFIAATLACRNLKGHVPLPPVAQGASNQKMMASELNFVDWQRLNEDLDIAASYCRFLVRERTQVPQQPQTASAAGLQQIYTLQYNKCKADQKVGIISADELTRCQQYGRSDLQGMKDEAFKFYQEDYKRNGPLAPYGEELFAQALAQDKGPRDYATYLKDERAQLDMLIGEVKKLEAEARYEFSSAGALIPIK